MGVEAAWEGERLGGNGGGGGGGAVVAAAASAAVITLLNLLFDGLTALVMMNMSVHLPGSSLYSSSHILMEPTWGFHDVSQMGGGGGWYSPIGVLLIHGCAGEHGFTNSKSHMSSNTSLSAAT